MVSFTRIPIQLRGDSIEDYMLRTKEEYEEEERKTREYAEWLHGVRSQKEAARKKKFQEAYQRRKAAKLAEHPLQKFSDGMAGIASGWFME